MADSKIQKIADQIIARMGLIDPDDAGYTANGFQTAIGVRCEDGRQNWDEKTGELPAISLFEGNTQSAEANDNRSKTIHLTPFRIDVALKARKKAADTMKDVRKAVSDIKRAIRLDDRWKVANVGLAMITREKGSGPVYAGEQSYEVVGAFVEIEVQWITNKFDAEQ